MPRNPQHSTSCRHSGHFAGAGMPPRRAPMFNTVGSERIRPVCTVGRFDGPRRPCRSRPDVDVRSPCAAPFPRDFCKEFRMSQYCVVVAEGSRARFFTVESATVPELESGPYLVERKTMANPEHKAHDQAIYSDLRAGRNRSAHGPGHGYDDHRRQHDAETERRFARDIARELGRIARGNGTRRVVLCAEKRMLGYLRPSLHNASSREFELTEVPKDLAKLSATEIQKKLSQEGHIPARRHRRGTN